MRIRIIITILLVVLLAGCVKFEVDLEFEPPVIGKLDAFRSKTFVIKTFIDAREQKDIFSIANKSYVVPNAVGFVSSSIAHTLIRAGARVVSDKEQAQNAIAITGELLQFNVASKQGLLSGSLTGHTVFRYTLDNGATISKPISGEWRVGGVAMISPNALSEPLEKATQKAVLAFLETLDKELNQ